MKKKALIFFISMITCLSQFTMTCYATDDEVAVEETTDEVVLNSEEEIEESDEQKDITSFEEVQESNVVNIIFHTSQQVELDESDTFIVNLTNLTNGNSEELTIVYSDNGMEYNLTAGEYFINEIEYTGEKNNFNYVGIATKTQFNNDGVENFNIYVGYDVIKNAAEIGESLYINQGGALISIDALENYDSAYDETFTGGTIQEDMQEDNEEAVNERLAKLRITKLKFMIIIFALTVLATFILYKMGKIKISQK